MAERRGGKRWTFLTNHAAVLLHVARNPDDPISAISDALGLSERATAGIIADLRTEGYIEARRVSRHNSYTVNKEMPLRRPYHSRLTVSDLLKLLATITDSEETAASR